jgi:hypothetical protein
MKNSQFPACFSRNGQTYLGSHTNNMSIHWSQGQQFIMNLLLYANIRDKLRSDIKKRERK